MPKTQTNIRLSTHSKLQLKALAARMGLSEGQLIMLAVDRLARDEGLRVHVDEEAVGEGESAGYIERGKQDEQ